MAGEPVKCVLAVLQHGRGEYFARECETMAGRIDDVLKEKLKAAGQWQAFQQRRDELKAQGYTPEDARTMALAEVMPKCDDGGDEPEQPSGEALPIAPAALVGKAAFEPEVARWVARNIDNPKADPGDCPDPFAWTLLRMCRESPSFALTFVRDIWTKLLVSQVRQGDEDTGGRIDGTPTPEFIERIREIRDRAESGQVEPGSTC